MSIETESDVLLQVLIVVVVGLLTGLGMYAIIIHSRLHNDEKFYMYLKKRGGAFAHERH